MTLRGTGGSLPGSGGTYVRRVPRPSIFSAIVDAAWLIVVVLALPLGILLIGAPLAFLIKTGLDLAQRLFG